MWQEALKVGDHILKDPGSGVLVYQKVVRMTRTPSRTRYVEGFSCLVPHGEFGDTFIHDALCIISPSVWALLEEAGFPANLTVLPLKQEVEVRGGARIPILVLDELGVN